MSLTSDTMNASSAPRPMASGSPMPSSRRHSLRPARSGCNPIREASENSTRTKGGLGQDLHHLAAGRAGMVTAVAADDVEHAGVAAFWCPSMMRTGWRRSTTVESSPGFRGFRVCPYPVASLQACEDAPCAGRPARTVGSRVDPVHWRKPVWQGERAACPDPRVPPGRGPAEQPRMSGPLTLSAHITRGDGEGEAGPASGACSAPLASAARREVGHRRQGARRSWYGRSP